MQEEGFSEAMIDRFFRPFLGGIFFNRELSVTSRLFAFVMRMLASGSNCLPAAGIGAVAEQVAAALPPGCVRLGVRADAVTAATGAAAASVTTAAGSIEAARGVVVAVEGPEAARLLADVGAGDGAAAPGVGTCCVYFSTDERKLPSDENILYLDGEGRGVVNNACFPSTVAPRYAPAGRALVSASTIGTHDDLSDAQLEQVCPSLFSALTPHGLGVFFVHVSSFVAKSSAHAGRVASNSSHVRAAQQAVREDLSRWFGGDCVTAMELLRIYRIPFAQPSQEPPTDLKKGAIVGGSVFVCGDHRTAATLEGAISSGRDAAQALLSS